ncbi:MAG: GreA/GreB family elongation factor [Phenylobacterium sp.]|uniref:GreA/GreB family elongation factor n=1 Tax=Phenylobacterium sp. TaxID=1871053 RepID=UPI0027346F09|nr:GreA/GreB family elongation factor [Phenylobacterium sp.]MDP3173338.1 GreA/GreB family elongation factor [Phenylobacterium sp.]
MIDVLGAPPSARPKIFVVDREYDPLADLVCSSARETVGLNLLWEELERATLLPSHKAPAGLIRMGSCVWFTDLISGESRSVRLVFPREPASNATVSVASSLGAALVGLCAGDEIEWRAADGKLRHVRVDSVAPPPPHKPKRMSLAELLADFTLNDAGTPARAS